MATTAAELQVKVGADTDEAERKIGGFGSKIGGAVGTLAKFGVAAGAAGAAAAVGFGVKAVMAASDLNETLSKTQVVFGDSMVDVTRFANQMAEDFGTPKQAILDAASSIGLIGKASGLSQKDAAGMSTQLAKMAVDASSFYNVPLEEALAAIQSGLVGEAEPMRRFGVLLNEGAVQAEALRLGLVKSGEELTEGAKAQARASLIMSGMADASGDLERTQGSLANRIKELKGRAANFTAEVGTKLLPIALAAFDLFEKWGPVIKDVVGGAFQAVGRFIAPVVRAFQMLLDVFRSGDDVLWGTAEVIDNLFGGTGALIQPILSLGNAFRSVISAVQGLIGGFGGANEATGRTSAMVSSAAGIFTMLKDVVMQLVAASLPVWSALIQAFADGAAFIQKMMPQIQEVITRVLNVIMGVWKMVGDDILNVVRTVFTTLARLIEAAMKIVKGVIQTVLSIITGDWGKAWDGIKMIFAGVWDAIGALLKGALSVIQSALGAALSVIQGVWTKVWGDIKDFLSGAWSAITGAVSGGIKAVVDFFAGLPGRIVDALASLGNKLVAAFKAAWGVWDAAVDTAVAATIRFFSELPGKIVSAIGNLGGLLVQAGKDLVQGLIDGIGNMAGAVKRKVGDIVDGVKGAIKGALKIFSPSRVTTGYGEMVALGLARGIANLTPRAVAEAGRMAEKLADAAKPDLGGLNMHGRGIGRAQALAQAPGFGPVAPSAGRNVTVAAGAVQLTINGGASLTEGQELRENVEAAFADLLRQLRRA